MSNADFFDMVLVNVPFADLQQPFAAPAILKGIAESHGFGIKTLDLNVLLNKICGYDLEKYYETSLYWQSLNPHKLHMDIVQQFYEEAVNEIAKYNSRYLGISVFYILSHRATFELCQLIRKRLPDVKIVLGGKGLGVFAHQSTYNDITTAEKKIMTFSQIMVKRKLTDHVIIGDAEDALIDLLKGDLSENNFDFHVPKSNTLEYPFANFDDYEFSAYLGSGEQYQLPVVSSKGCVRSCDFCDVPSQFQKFQSKSGKRLAEEVIFLANKYNIHDFSMHDSIANGNLKTLREFCQLMTEHNAVNEPTITWNGNWINRPPNMLKPDFFDILKQSGAKHFTIGAEHGSDGVLEAMNKKTTVAGLFYELDQLERVGIQAGLNSIVGHWAETYEYFMQHMETIIKLAPLMANKTVDYISVAVFHVMKNTPAEMNTSRNQLMLGDDDLSQIWYTPINPNLTIKARAARHLFAYRVYKYLHVPVVLKTVQIRQLVERLESDRSKWNNFISSKLNKNEYQPCQIFQDLDRWQEITDNLVRKNFPQTKLVIDITSSSFNGDPRFIITHNKKCVYDQHLSPGQHCLEFLLHNDFDNLNELEFEMLGKNQFDTEIDQHGKIINDKNIVINSIHLDRVDIIDTSVYPFFYKNFTAKDKNNQPLDVHCGFWQDSKLKLEYQAPFWQFYMTKIPMPSHWAYNDYKDFDRALDEYQTCMLQFDY